jgi:hypothetical protein
MDDAWMDVGFYGAVILLKAKKLIFEGFLTAEERRVYFNRRDAEAGRNGLRLCAPAPLR